MPDFTPNPQLVLVSGNQLVAFMQATGTNSGPLMGMPASNKKVGFLGARYVVFADDGRMKEDWHIADMTTILHQTGNLKGVKLPMPPRVDLKPVMDKPEIVMATDSKTEADNVAVVTKLDEAYGKGDAKAVGELLTDDFTYRDNTMSGEMKGKDSSVKMLEAMNKAWSDKKWESKARFGAGDYVASIGTYSATNTGDMPMMKMKKTGKTTTTTMINIYHLTAGKVDSMWGFSNGYAWYVQMGIITPKTPEGGAAPAAEEPKKKTN
jgi:predicted ester cyclase